jgi:hypothetical protein
MNHVHVLLVRGSPFHADRPERRRAEQCILGLGFETETDRNYYLTAVPRHVQSELGKLSYRQARS